MPDVTADQMLDLAHSFHALAFAVGQVRLNALNVGARLSDPGMVELKEQLLSLTEMASRFALASATVTLDDTEKAIGTIQASTGRADAALQRLKDVDKAIAIGAAALALGAAVFSMNASSIAITAEELWQAAN